MVQPGEVVAEEALSFVCQDVKEAILKVHVLDVTYSVLCIKIDLVLSIEVNEKSIGWRADNARRLRLVEDEEFRLLVEVGLEVIKVFRTLPVEIELDNLVARY